MDWTKEQKKVIDTRECNLLVSAAAGSGKTAVLVERIIQMVFDKDNPIDIDRLLVVTFTKAAASQMKEKIAQAIEKKISDNPANDNYVRQLNLLRDANILTIDSFCYRIVKEYFHVIAVDPKVRVAEESELEIVKQEILEDVIEDFYKNNMDFCAFSNAYSADKNDDVIEDYILKLYTLSESYPFPDAWLKNARNNLQVESEDDILGMDFMQVYINDIHIIAKEIRGTILQYLDMSRSDNGPSHYEETLLSDVERIDSIISAKTYSVFNDLCSGKFATLKRAKKSDVFDVDIAELIKKGRDTYKKQINSLLNIFSLPIEDVLMQCRLSEKMLCSYIDITMEFSKRFLKRKTELGLVGFNDVEHYALQILCSGVDDAGNIIPSGIGKELSSRFYEILIDEYQDSNYLQENILRCVSRVPYGDNNIFMVGDVKQSIYAFRMARPNLFTEKYNTYKELSDEGIHDEVKILLQRNFRSRKNILDFTNYIFCQIMRSSIGGIEYTDKEELNAGRIYPDNEQDSVEFLLGESKDHSDLVNAYDPSENESEHLDDEYIDVSGMELEAGMIADRIYKLMGGDGNAPQMITDDVTGKMRPIEYRDIVILLRSPKSYQPVFSEILMKRDIPVRLQNENGYFDMVEIQGLITFLKMLDNPYNDVECAALLRGYFGKMNSDELSILTLMRRYVQDNNTQYLKTKYLYSFIVSVVENEKLFFDIYNGVFQDEKERVGFDEYSCGILFEKCINVVDNLTHFRNEKNICSITELIEKIYFETDYYYHVMAMPQGKERSRNLMLFLEETKKYEYAKTRTLFDFLRFVKRISERQISLGGDAASESSENMVRIMSIHRSKGLEFPVVFVSGLGKKINMSDTKLPIILHSDYYISAKYVNLEKRCVSDTFMRKSVAALMKLEMIAEELRVFYVALTRAKEKLILSAVTPDIVKLVKKYESCATVQTLKLKHSVISSVDSYLDILAASLVRNVDFHNAMKNIKQRYDKDGKLISAGYDVENYIENGNLNIDISVFPYNDMIHSQIDTGVDKVRSRIDKFKKFSVQKSANIEVLNKNLDWKYIDDDIKNQKSKMSVTEIKRIHQIKDETLNEEEKKENVIDTDYKEIMPRFVAGDVSMNASIKGTWFHKVMELIDNRKLDGIYDASNELGRLYDEGLIPEETRTFITADKINAFSKSMLGKRMHQAALNNRLYKERKFVVGFPVKENAPEVVVQGIIDAYFEENGKIILLDYKTDKIKEGQEKILVDRYKTQMDYYRKTLEKITGLEISEVYLYSFALDKEIKI